MAGEHILVVDDEEDILELVSYGLTKAGYRVSKVTSGEDAIKAARSKLPDLVLLDLMLPGVDGLEVCNTLKRDPRTANIPVVMLAARGEDYAVTDRSVDVHIVGLRKKLGPLGKQIETVHGVGYRFRE